MYPSLQLKKDEERRLLAGHLWVYSNEIDVATTPLTSIKPGNLVEIKSARGKFLGVGYCNPNTLLCARLLTRDKITISSEFFIQRIKQALQLRETLFHKPFYRLIYGEGDGLPGLIVDRYDNICVIQITTLGMWQLKTEIINALQAVIKPTSLLVHTTATAGTEIGLPEVSEEIGAAIPELVLIEENNAKFYVNVKTGQKTGWFYDQRNNHARTAHYVPNKNVLDVCCYVGGFGIQAAVAGAKTVICVDSSASAIQLVTKNAALNQVTEKVHVETMTAMDYLKQAREQNKVFDVIVLDPPAFIKRRKDLKAGSEAYQRLNTLALSVLAEDGILVSCSCSMQFTLEMLVDCVRKAALNSKSNLQILEYGFQAADHPIHPAIAETAYLKVLFSRKIPAF
jgi:23S rRNA (cytosine1962-C5)-methyltransferase